MSGLEKACRIRQTENGDWVISPPPGVRLYIEGDTRIHDNLSYHFRPDMAARNVMIEQAFIIRVTPTDNNWLSVAWSPELELFAAVSDSGTFDRVMTSPDGINWTDRVTPTSNNWRSVAWSPELGLFAAVAFTGTNDRVMTSPDGIEWTIRVTPTDNDWFSIAWSPELRLFAAVSDTGTNNRVMTSPDGINWTIRVTPADNDWFSIAWSPELRLFAVVSYSGTFDRAMTSPDGIEWTIRVTPTGNNWTSVAWSPELRLFAAVAYTGTFDRVMTSPDGINWTDRVTPTGNNWRSIAWSPELGLFVAVSETGTNDKVMTSPDGINWTDRVTLTGNNWRSIAWSPELGLFAAVATSGTGDRVMTSAVGRCRIQQDAADDWELLPPAGQIVRIGNALGGFVPPVTNDDLMVTGRMASYGTSTSAGGFSSVGDSGVFAELDFTMIGGYFGESESRRTIIEEITIPNGSGAAGVVSAAGLFSPNSVITSVHARVTQAPGGGATTFDIYRTGIPADVLIDNMPVTVDGVGSSPTNSDGTHDGPFYNTNTRTLTIKTNANVTGADMKVRVCVNYTQFWHFDS